MYLPEFLGLIVLMLMHFHWNLLFGQNLNSLKNLVLHKVLVPRTHLTTSNKTKTSEKNPFVRGLLLSYYFPVNRSDLKRLDNRPIPYSTKRLSILIDASKCPLKPELSWNEPDFYIINLKFKFLWSKDVLGQIQPLNAILRKIR